MILLFLLLIYVIPFLIALWAAYFIASKTYKALLKNNNSNARLVEVLVFIGVFVLLGALCYWIIEENFQLKR